MRRRLGSSEDLFFSDFVSFGPVSVGQVTSAAFLFSFSRTMHFLSSGLRCMKVFLSGWDNGYGDDQVANDILLEVSSR